MSTPERQQDPGEHGYAGVAEEAGETVDTDEAEHPPEDRASDLGQDEDERAGPADADSPASSRARAHNSRRLPRR